GWCSYEPVGARSRSCSCEQGLSWRIAAPSDRRSKQDEEEDVGLTPGLMARLSAYATDQERQQTVRYDPFVTPTMNDRYLRIAVVHPRRSRLASMRQARQW